MLTIKDYSKFPWIIEVTAMLDCSVLEESEYGGDTGREQHFWIGDSGDRSVGLPSFTASPSFHTLQELNQFCRENKASFDKVSEQIDQTGEYPDVWFWEQPESALKKSIKP